MIDNFTVEVFFLKKKKYVFSLTSIILLFKLDSFGVIELSIYDADIKKVAFVYLCGRRRINI